MSYNTATWGKREAKTATQNLRRIKDKEVEDAALVEYEEEEPVKPTVVYVLLGFVTYQGTNIIGIYNDLDKAKAAGIEAGKKEYPKRWGTWLVRDPVWEQPAACSHHVLWIRNDCGYRIEPWEVEE